MNMASRGWTRGGKFLLRALVAVSLLVGCLSSAVAQDTDEGETGTIKGTVTSTKGGPVTGVRVLITDRTTGKTVALRTDAAGAFASEKLAATDYTVRAEVRSFITVTTSATVKPGAVTTVDLALAPEALPGIVSEQEIENFPLRSRNFLEFLQVEPSVQNQNAGTVAPNKNANSSVSLFSRLGTGTPLQTDGLNITDFVSGGVVQNLPANSIQELQFGG